MQAGFQARTVSATHAVGDTPTSDIGGASRQASMPRLLSVSAHLVTPRQPGKSRSGVTRAGVWERVGVTCVMACHEGVRMVGRSAERKNTFFQGLPIGDHRRRECRREDAAARLRCAAVERRAPRAWRPSFSAAGGGPRPVGIDIRCGLRNAQEGPQMRKGTGTCCGSGVCHLHSRDCTADLAHCQSTAPTAAATCGPAHHTHTGGGCRRAGPPRPPRHSSSRAHARALASQKWHI